MAQTMYVKPREGGRVRMPDRNFRPMPAEGYLVPCIDYYNRLVLTGDLVKTDPPAPAASAPAAPTQQPQPSATSAAAAKPTVA
jgi:hypothetical protein